MLLKRFAQNRNVSVLFAVILLSSLSVNLSTPIWAFYITSLGASVVELGYISAIPSAVSAFVNILGGSLSDRYGRRKLNALGTCLGTLPPLFYIFAKNWVELIPWVILSGLAGGLGMPVRWSMIADSSSEDRRAMMFGLMNIALLLGMTVAPILGGLIADAYGIRTTFVLYFVLMSASFFCSLLLQESMKPLSRHQTQKSDTAESRTFVGTMLIVLTLNVAVATGTGIYSPITPLFLEKRFSTVYADVGILYAIGFGLSSMMVQIPGGKMATKYNRKKLVIVTTVLSTPFFGLFALSRSFVECVILMFLSNVILNLSWPAYQDLTMALTPPSRRGLMNGLSGTSFLAGMMIGQAISGILWESFGMFLPYYLSAVLVLISALPAFFLKETGSRAQP